MRAHRDVRATCAAEAQALEIAPQAKSGTYFYIGAHAAVQGMKILTRDPKRFTSYFPTVNIIEP
jgi:predicted nucleic acid-binding protein